ncbi:MAG: PDC sensor domain-containing protein, partial [Phycisphaeraceae bacterium]|nr:PDC sensor domain-containing protein [Phycisphaeraceae bacterium]
LTKQIDASDKMDAKVKAFSKAELLPLCTNPVFVKAVKEQNAKKATLDEIKKIDDQWQKAEEELPIQKEKMSNVCAEEIKKVAGKLSAISETFVMDNQGANVGQNALTSDYWQGDEPKWQKSFNEGKGGLDVGKPTLDKSTDIVDQKVSLPIVDEEGKVIGAICVGVKTGSL